MAIRRTVDVPVELLEAFVRCGEVSAYLVSVLSDDVWRADRGRSRTVAAIVAHMLSLRRTFARAGGATHTGRTLDRRTITRDMLTYLIQHDAHHRGQIIMSAKALGHAFTTDDVMRIWGWKKLPPAAVV